LRSKDIPIEKLSPLILSGLGDRAGLRLIVAHLGTHRDSKAVPGVDGGQGKHQRDQLPTKWMVVVDGQGIPLGKQLYSASPNEVRLAEETLASIRVSRRQRGGRPGQKPQRVIADRAYDSDPLRERLAARGIELVAPHRWNRSKPRTQDGRALRRYRRRWKVERTFAWLGNFRRLVVRYDRSTTIYEAFFHIACLMITLRRVLK
jgi:transposase